MTSEEQKVFLNLCEWFQASARDLPWRKDRTPWRVWVSEIMLQQTQVKTVIPYYQRFMTQYPTLEALVKAPIESVLKNWEGLGYYARCRHLVNGAHYVLNQFNGHIPMTYTELIKVPGIGDYTAGALLSFCDQQAIPAVDGNVVRVISRFKALPLTQGDLRDRKQARQYVADILEEGSLPPDQLNEGFIELGALICTPTKPDCANCPLSMACLACKKKIVDQLPKPKPKKIKQIEHYTVLVLVDIKYQQILLHHRTTDRLLHGLWDFMMLDGALSTTEVRDRLDEADVQCINLQPLKPIKHVFTHLIWQLHPYIAYLNLEKSITLPRDIEYCLERMSQQKPSTLSFMETKLESKSKSDSAANSKSETALAHPILETIKHNLSPYSLYTESDFMETTHWYPMDTLKDKAFSSSMTPIINQLQLEHL